MGVLPVPPVALVMDFTGVLPRVFVPDLEAAIPCTKSCRGRMRCTALDP
jgi:hypothetical protein